MQVRTKDKSVNTAQRQIAWVYRYRKHAQVRSKELIQTYRSFLEYFNQLSFGKCEAHCDIVTILSQGPKHPRFQIWSIGPKHDIHSLPEENDPLSFRICEARIADISHHQKQNPAGRNTALATVQILESRDKKIQLKSRNFAAPQYGLQFRSLFLPVCPNQQLIETFSTEQFSSFDVLWNFMISYSSFRPYIFRYLSLPNLWSLIET